MADDSLLPAPDPDFPENPHAAALRTKLVPVAAALPASFWPAMRRSLAVAGLLHDYHRRQPALNTLPAAIGQLTELTPADTERLSHLPDALTFLLEGTLRAADFQLFLLVARHLLDTPLATFVFRHQMPPELAYSFEEERIVQHMRGAYGKTYEFWIKQMAASASEERPELDLPLLNAQLASLVEQASKQPNLFFDAAAPDSAATWPLAPAEGEPVRECRFPPGYLLYLQMGISALLLAAYKLTSPWVSTLLAHLPTARVAGLRSITTSPLDCRTKELLTVPLGLATAADLHLAAHLSGLLVASPSWDELATHGLHLSDAGLTSLPAGLLPSGVSLPPPGPAPATLRSDLGLVATYFAEHLEELFGADEPALAANRALAARLAELL